MEIARRYRYLTQSEQHSILRGARCLLWLGNYESKQFYRSPAALEGDTRKSRTTNMKTNNTPASAVLEIASASTESKW
jgi:hypothetical protein